MPALPKINEVLQLYTQSLPQYHKKTYEITIDLIIPIYNGYELLEPLLQSIKQTKVKYHGYLIDDCSTDPRIKDYLQRYEKQESNVTIWYHNQNQGYIKSVNEGFLQCKHHVVLLNTDVCVPEEWLERLMQPILQNNMVASVTPFSNAGSLCSFPEVNQTNPLFLGLSVKEIDEIFQKIKPKYDQIPTGVGFCMAINKDALDNVGTYNEIDYKNAYGEENDWCERAISYGYHHVIADNLFVYHKHHASYNIQKMTQIRKANSSMLAKQHPTFFRKITIYRKHIPYKKLLQLHIMQCASYKARNNSYLIFTHSSGGGATIFIDKKIQTLCQEGALVYVVLYRKNHYEITFRYHTYSMTYNLEKIETLSQLFAVTPCHHILVNELVRFPHIQKTIAQILYLKKSYGGTLTFYVHDYFCICPTIHLLNEETRYCGFPSGTDCSKCRAAQNALRKYACNNISTWRELWKEFLQCCNHIHVFSNNSKQLLTGIYGTLDSILLTPHNVTYITTVNKQEEHSHLIIGILGTITNEKGSMIVHEMAQFIGEHNLNIKIVVFGQLSPHPKNECIVVDGPYKKEAISTRMTQYGIDVILIPSIIPETFSLTTEEAIRTNLPVAVFDLGAQAERVKRYEKGIIIKEMTGKAVIEMIKDR